MSPVHSLQCVLSTPAVLRQASDITQGLPRVEELFEARRPKGLALIAEIGGTITVTESKRKREDF